MMELFHNLALGFGVAVTLENLAYCLLGVTLGTLVGVLPGIGPLVTMALLLPFTFNVPTVAALVMLAGIYYGSQYGGSTTAILVNIPGESASVVTCMDGYAMARQGRAGAALGIAALASFFAGCASLVVVTLFAPPLAEVALKFGSAENFSLVFLGLIAAAMLARGSLVKALAMILFGVLLGLVGTDVNSGVRRFTFGITSLSEGVDFVVIAMGLFAFGEIVANLEATSDRVVYTSAVKHVMPTLADLKASWRAAIRGTALGSVLGILPGGGAILASFASYTVEKRVAADPSRFGHGAIEGVAGPEAANNAGAQTSFIPMLTLGIPSNAVMAIMLGALTMQGVVPGPQVMSRQPDLFWGVIASMWIGNLFLVLLNLPLIRIWVALLRIPYRMLYPAILVFSCVGLYSLHNSPMDLFLGAAFGLLGYVFVKLDCEPAPLLLGLVLGPLMEENLRRTMLLFRGDPLMFLTRPISMALLAAAMVLIVLLAVPVIRSRREAAFKGSA